MTTTRLLILLLLIVSAQACATKQACKDYASCTPLAEQGNPEAQRLLGWLYKYGAIKDKEKSFKWWLLSAEQGDKFGQNSVGNIYLSRGDYCNAKYWYNKSAAQGGAAANYHLGVMYLRGEQVAVNRGKAREFLQLAASQDYDEAKKTLKEIDKNPYPEGMGPIYTSECLAELPNGVLANQNTPVGVSYNQEITSLLAAVRAADAKAVAHFLDQPIVVETNLNPLCPPNSRCKPVTFAAEQVSPKIMTMLLDAGAGVDGKSTGSGDTPLIGAIARGNFEVVKLLVSRGAKVNLTNRFHVSPLCGASAKPDGSSYATVLLDYAVCI